MVCLHQQGELISVPSWQEPQRRPLANPLQSSEEHPVTIRCCESHPINLPGHSGYCLGVRVCMRVCVWGRNTNRRFSLLAVIAFPSTSRLSSARHYLSTVTQLPCHLRRRICVRSKVVKLIPTAIGPLTQFMLRPLYKPRMSPSSRMISDMVRRMEV